MSAYRAAVISGAAGTGKSRLAAEYAHRCGVDGFWTDAGSDVDATLAALAPALDVDVVDRSESEIAVEVRKTLTGLPKDTLWVIDDVGDLRLVSELLDAAVPVRLLLTTRDARKELVPATVAWHRIESLDLRAGIDLLCSRSECDPGDPALREIAEMVGCLPLALEMLAVRLGQPRTTPEKLLAELRKVATPIEVQPFQEAAGTTVPRADGVYATITGTLAALPHDVREQLSPLGYVADAPVPVALVRTLTDVDDEGLDRLLAECGRQSVLTVREGQVIVHALTAAAIAATNADGALRSAILKARARLVSIYEDDPVALRTELAHHERLYGHAGQRMGGEDSTTLEFANSLAIAYHTAGRLDEEVRVEEAVLAARERVLGPDHPDTLNSRNNLAAGYWAAGRTQDAIRLDEETLAARERVLGPDHPVTLRSRDNLAVGYVTAGRTEEAIGLGEKTLAALERLLGPDHPDTLTSRNNLAAGYWAAGRTEEAIRMHEETLAAKERVLGPDHPSTLGSRSNLAVGYWAAGRTEEAIRMHEETLAARERVLGPDHPDTLASRNNLANGYWAAARTEDAVLLWEETLAAKERVLGPDHPDTLTTRSNLAEGYRAVGRDDDADRLEGKESAKTKPKRKPGAKRRKRS